MLPILNVFVDYINRFDFRMGAFILYKLAIFAIHMQYHQK